MSRLLNPRGWRCTVVRDFEEHHIQLFPEFTELIRERSCFFVVIGMANCHAVYIFLVIRTLEKRDGGTSYTCIAINVSSFASHSTRHNIQFCVKN